MWFLFALSVILSWYILLWGTTRQMQGDTNVALGAVCCASSQYSSAFRCDLALDGRTNTEYAGLMEGVGMWLSLQLNQMYLIRGLRVMCRANDWERPKDLRLTFMDGSEQTVTLTEFPWGSYWDRLMALDPVVTNTVTVTAVTVYGTGNNGFIEFELYGIPAPTDSLPAPVCPTQSDTSTSSEGDWRTVVKGTVEPASWMTKDFFYENLSCFIKCVQSLGCKGVVVHVATGECTMGSATCLLYKVAGNDSIIWKL